MSSNSYASKDRAYTFGIIPPVEAIKVEVAIARVIGEPLFKAFMGAEEGGSRSEKAIEQVSAAAVGLMLAKMDAEELIATMTIVMNYISCDNKRVDLNATFVGRNKELWQVFIAALRYNFKDFLDVSPLALKRKEPLPG